MSMSDDLGVFTSFHPFRLSKKNNEPVEMIAQVENKTNEPKALTLQLSLSLFLSFDRGGINRSQRVRIESLNPGEIKKFYFDIYAKQLTEPGEHALQLKVTEHFRNFSYVVNESKLKLSLTVTE